MLTFNQLNKTIMKKNFLWSLLAMTMLTLGCGGVTSCGGDDDDVTEQENTSKQAPWISGLVRGYYWKGLGGAGFTLYGNIGLGELGSATFVEGSSLSVLDFRQDGTVLEYDLQETNTASKIKEIIQKNQGSIEPIYAGTWTLFEGHPEWSYFQGKITKRNGEVEREVVNPKKYTYTLNPDDLSVTATDSDGKAWSWGTLFINFNPSKTAWSELRNSQGALMFFIWNPDVPLDNSKFNNSNNQ